MATDRNRNSVLRQLMALQKMHEPELQEKWRDLYGSEPPQFKMTFLKKRLAYRIQELFYGGLSNEAKSKLAKLAGNDSLANLIRKKDADKGPGSHGRILPGTRFVREWNGNRYEVTAVEDGFEFDGRIFRSLSAVATEITGTKWNGLVFWGMKKR